MRSTRKKVIKTVYKDEDDSEDEKRAGDFSDSGSEAEIPENSSSEDEFEEVPSSAEEFDEGSSKKKPKTKTQITQRVRKTNVKFAKEFISKINRHSAAPVDEEEPAPPLISVKDLTEEDKLLPSFLNLSESDSSDDESAKAPAKKQPTASSSSMQVSSDSETENQVEYKDVFSSHQQDDSEEIAKKTFMELEKHKSKIEEAKASALNYQASKTQPGGGFDVKDLLAQGEEVMDIPAPSPVKKGRKGKKAKDDSDSEMEDWEEVKEAKSIPQQGIQLVVDFPDASCSRKKKALDIEMMMKRKINRVKKEYQVYMHKVHVLCWLGHGNYVSRVLNDQEVMAAALSLVPKGCYPGDRVDLKYIEQITTWYKDKFTLKQDKNEDKFRPKAPPLKQILLEQIKNRTVTAKKYLVFIFVSMLRAIGLQCRVMFNFVTVPIKPPSSELCSLSMKPKESKNENSLKKDNKQEKSQSKASTSKGKAKVKIPQVDGLYDMYFTSDTDNNTDMEQLNGNYDTVQKRLYYPRTYFIINDTDTSDSDNSDTDDSNTDNSDTDNSDTDNSDHDTSNSYTSDTDLVQLDGNDDPPVKKRSLRTTRANNNASKATENEGVSPPKRARRSPTPRNTKTTTKSIEESSAVKNEPQKSQSRSTRQNQAKSVASKDDENKLDAEKKLAESKDNATDKSETEDVPQKRKRTTRQNQESTVKSKGKKDTSSKTTDNVTDKSDAEDLTQKTIRPNRSTQEKPVKSKEVEKKLSQTSRATEDAVDKSEEQDVSPKRKIPTRQSRERSLTPQDVKNKSDANKLTKIKESPVKDNQEKAASQKKLRATRKSQEKSVKSDVENKLSQSEENIVDKSDLKDNTQKIKRPIRQSQDKSVATIENKSPKTLKTKETVTEIAIDDKMEVDTDIKVAKKAKSVPKATVHSKKASDSKTDTKPNDPPKIIITNPDGCEINVASKYFDGDKKKLSKLSIRKQIQTVQSSNTEKEDDLKPKSRTGSRKRSQTTQPLNVEKDTDVIKSKPRTKSAPGNSVETSKYFNGVGNKSPETKLVRMSRKEIALEDTQRVSHKDLLAKNKGKPSNDVTEVLVDIIKNRVKEAKENSKKGKVKGKIKQESDDESDYLPEEEPKRLKSESDDDFKPTKISPKPRPSTSKKLDRRVLSSDSEELPKNKCDVWAEVFVEELEQWISVDVVRGKVHCPNEIHIHATHPVCYVVGWDNNNNLKDLTRRYVPHWNTVTRKQRAESPWWERALAPYKGLRTARDCEEDDQLNRIQLDAPLPKSISEYKNHPLYALKRHLLKFEAIYPPNAATLGFVRGEPVYARECVYVCRSRDTWLKEAKVVKLGETPYKVVKARPKWDKLSNKMITDKPLEVFGPWQCQEYEPPVAENGVVPRNAYGNVELFKPCMLPKGTVHIKLPGLNRVAKKLNIDCAPAMTGFDFNGGWSHPVYDGFVVCKEFEEVIQEAWLKDQEDQERREREKIESRVYGNWRRLIKGLFIRERLKHKYGFDDPAAPADKKKKGPRFVAKKS